LIGWHGKSGAHEESVERDTRDFVLLLVSQCQPLLPHTLQLEFEGVQFLVDNKVRDWTLIRIHLAYFHLALTNNL